MIRPTRWLQTNSRISKLFRVQQLFLILILLSVTHRHQHQVSAGQYISDRLCQKITAKLNQTNVQSQQATTATGVLSYLETHQLSYLNLNEGAKHSFWIQCIKGDWPSNDNSSRGAAANKHSSHTSNLNYHSQTHREVKRKNNLDNIDSILDWTFGGESNDDAVEESTLLDDEYSTISNENRINDDRYDYLLSVANHCHKPILKRCNYFKIGLINSQDVTKCPACGLNDSNCDNVHQCTSTCGQIKSINYPQNYGNNHRCRWSIRAPNSYYVNLSVIDFDIPSANNATKLGTCIFDYLTLIDGYTGKRIGCYCNENLPPSYIVSPWNELIIQFDTNSETTGRGFYFQYEFMRLELNDRIRSQLASPNAVSNNNIDNILNNDPVNIATVNVQPAIINRSNPLHNTKSTNNISLCPLGWRYFRGSCYRAFNEIEPLQWYDAENKCNLFGEGLDGHLVSILDKDEMIVILYWLTNVWNSTRYREYYIGLIDVSREGLYRWSDNNPMSYTDWELKPMLLEDETPAQPDGGAYEDCTVIRYSSFSRTSNWHDVPCSLGKHYHSHLDKTQAINFKWDYVSSYICKSDSISVANSLSRSKVRRPLFSNEFKPSPYSDQLLSHLSSTGTSESSASASNQVQSLPNKTTSPMGMENNSINNNEHSMRQVAGLPSSSPIGNETGQLQIVNSSSNNMNILANSTNSSHQQQQQLTTNGKRNNNFDRSSSFFHLSKLDDNRYFVCDNLEVISTVLRCDGIAHCRDGSDESNGCDQDCLDWQFKCANGRCISIGYYCDFSDDCGDGSDESRCERHRCKLNEFRCQSGQCIPAQQRCDLLPDCRDFSDEGRSCTIGSNCNSASTFQCYNGLCIPQYAVCDFQIDCPGKFHEDEDASTCELLQRHTTTALGHQTSSNSRANFISLNMIEHAQRSASAQQLLLHQNYSDHLHQTPSVMVVFYPANQAASIDLLPSNLFRCKSGNTIDISQRCLFEFDKYGFQLGCRDVSHLVDCDSFECPQRDYVKCPNSYCIPWRYVCDGKWDCIMGDDEVGCARYVCPGQYKCANQSSCILLHQLCDGHRQCPMGDDEWFCDLQCPVGCDCIGQSVSCRGANMSQLASNYISRSVRKLDLSYNRLGPNLSNSNFDSYHDLGELILSHNDIEVLTPRKFHQLRNLYKLDLSYNQIHSVKRGAFAGLRRVTQLLLESNQQLALLEPEAFLGLSSLQILNISSSRIHTLKKNTFDGLTSLRHLLLRSNMINKVEDGSFRSLTNLVSLDMRGNDIKQFTKSVFSELKSLRNLSTNSFKFCCLMNHQIPVDKCLPLPDEISDCEDLLSSVPQRTCIWIAGGIACVGNLIVIIWRYRDRLGQRVGEVQEINSSLLLSLACSDLLMGIYLIIIALVDSWYRGHYIENADKWRESPLCNLCGFLSTVSSTVSVLTLVFIAHNRFLEICRPFNTRQKFTPGYTHCLIKLSWIMALTIATLPLLIWPYFQGQFYARSGVCLAFHITDQRAAGWLYAILVSPFLNLIAFLFIFNCYIRIYLKISRKKRASPMDQSAGPMMAAMTTTASSSSVGVKAIEKDLRRQNHRFKIMIIVMVHFVAFSPPIMIGFMSLAGYTPPAALYSWIAVLVLPTNSAINPMIYTIPNIRQTIDDLIENYKLRKSGIHLNNSAKKAGRHSVISMSATTTAVSTTAAANGQRLPNSNSRAPIGWRAMLPRRFQSSLQAKNQNDDQIRDLIRRPSRRNIPPGYCPLEHYLSHSNEVNAEQLVEIALQIAKDIEEKYKRSKVYASLSLNDVFVSDRVLSIFDDDKREEFERRISIFVADHDGYRDKRSQPCSLVTRAFNKSDGGSSSSSNNTGGNSHQSAHHRQHHHRNHKSAFNCECYDVSRFGDILLKLIELYDSRPKSDVTSNSNGSAGGQN